MCNPDYNTIWAGLKDVTIRSNPGLALREVKITSSGKDPRGITSKIPWLLGEDSRVQKIMMQGKSQGAIPGYKVVGHSSLDKMHLGKIWTGTR